MTTTTVKQPTSNLETINLSKNDIELDLDKLLSEVWNQGVPNGILDIH